MKKNRMWLFFGAIAIAAAFSFILFFIGTHLYLILPLPVGERQIHIGGHALAVQVADTPASRMRGLSGRDAIGADGMLFLFDAPGSYGFWMQGMRFPIDIIWIRDGRVIGIVANAPVPSGILPPIFNPPAAITSVLELPAGDAERFRISTSTDVIL